jgi:hypothetical protein
MVEGHGEQKQRMKRPVAMHHNGGTATQRGWRVGEGCTRQRESAVGGGGAADRVHRHSLRGDRITDAIIPHYSA